MGNEVRRDHSPEGNDSLQDGVAEVRALGEENHAKTNPHPQRHAGEKTCNDSESARQFVAQPQGEHAGPNYLISQPGGAREKEEKVKRYCLMSRPLHGWYAWRYGQCLASSLCR